MRRRISTWGNVSTRANDGAASHLRIMACVDVAADRDKAQVLIGLFDDDLHCFEIANSISNHRLDTEWRLLEMCKVGDDAQFPFPPIFAFSVRQTLYSRSVFLVSFLGQAARGSVEDLRGRRTCAQHGALVLLRARVSTTRTRSGRCVDEAALGSSVCVSGTLVSCALSRWFGLRTAPTAVFHTGVVLRRPRSRKGARLLLRCWRLVLPLLVRGSCCLPRRCC